MKLVGSDEPVYSFTFKINQFCESRCTWLISYCSRYLFQFYWSASTLCGHVVHVGLQYIWRNHITCSSHASPWWGRVHDILADCMELPLMCYLSLPRVKQKVNLTLNKTVHIYFKNVKMLFYYILKYHCLKYRKKMLILYLLYFYS